MYSSKYLELLIEELSRLPSIGPKSAQRLALHLLRASREDALRLAEAIRAVKERVRFCSVCGNFAEEDPCKLCLDPGRDGIRPSRGSPGIAGTALAGRLLFLGFLELVSRRSCDDS